jgi:ketosteroid isomerase-like protein
MDERLRTVNQFLRCFGRGDFDDAGRLLHPKSVVRWPNTREIFHGRERFLDANRRYPGKWAVRIVSVLPCGAGAASVISVHSGKGRPSFHAVSFYGFRNGLISRITEYWGQDGEPPAWRKRGGWAKRY